MPVWRWLPAKSTIESHFLVFYAHVPDGFSKVDSIELQNGQIVIEDRTAQKKITLAPANGRVTVGANKNATYAG